MMRTAMKYRLDWNERFDSGKTPNGFQLHYVPTPAEPPTVPCGERETRADRRESAVKNITLEPAVRAAGDAAQVGDFADGTGRGIHSAD